MKVLHATLSALIFIWMGCAVSPAAETPTEADTTATMQLAVGDYVAGVLCDCPRSGILRWQSSAFTTPFDFLLGAVSAVRFPTPVERPQPKGQYCLELEGGDVVFGVLVGLSAQEATLETAGHGLLHVQRSAIQRILHWRGQFGLLYVGPNGLSEWKEALPRGGWRQEAGQLIAVRNGASLSGEFGIPAQACIEFELSWTAEPDFLLALGAGGEQDQQAFRLEVWDRQLVLLRETQQKADVALLQEIAAGEGRCHFRVYLDQGHGRAIALAADGKLLADLNVADVHWRLGSGLRLINHRGGVRLEQLRITRWNGEAPREAQANQARLRRFDGAMVDGEIKGFDPSAQEFLVARDGRETRLSADAVESIALLPSDSRPECDLRAVLLDGARLSGNLWKVEKGRLWLRCPGVKEPLGIGVAELQSLIVLKEQKWSSRPNGRYGWLETDGLKLRGCLVEGSQRADASCLVWQPRGSKTASPLKPGVAGRIVYREPPPPPPSSQLPGRGQAMLPQVAGAVGVVVLGDGLNGPIILNARRETTGSRSNTDSSPPAPAYGSAMYLRTGDTIPCEVKRIDEYGITFHSSLVDVTSVTHDKVKAVELENRSRATKIDPSKRDRLLTLPRMEKDDPPTHLIRSTQGDYLRGRLIAMDDKTLTVEVRLETRRLPRDRVARIIWLDKKESPAKSNAADAKRPAASRLQVLRNDGIRLTFCAEKLTGTTLQGASDVLGACRVDLEQVDQLLLGGAIEQTAQTLPYQRWKLQPAVEPKFISAAAPGGALGTESALVGKPAPDFELDQLDGQRFRLGDHRGKIVVLDFWATWCGPCVQTLPQVVRAAKEFENRNVLLVAVNLQENPKAITAMLEQLKLKATVALDRSGAVAEKYAAVAIPQTVVIDASGNVARVFVGGGPQYAEQIRGALQAVATPATGQGTLP